MDTLTFIKPDDCHLHLRDGAALASVVNDSARQFARAIVMPNLLPPITTVQQAMAYRQRILDCVDPSHRFEPLMTLYLTDNTAEDEIDQLLASDGVYALKYYPAGATTNSASGVTNIHQVMPTLEYMAQQGVPLLVHGEVTDKEIDIFDRERVFIDRVLAPLVENMPSLKVVLEHITTADAVDFVKGGSNSIAATITPHHLIYNRNAIFEAGINPHHYCSPVLKRERHRLALVDAATSGDSRFFLGTDSAPHAVGKKEAACGCAGIYNAHAALETYATVFAENNSLDKLEAFAGINGARFYGLPINKEQVTLIKEPWTIPDRLEFDDTEVAPFMAGQICNWKLVDE